MHSRRSLNKIYPKVSTLPRPRSEAAQYLDMYKLAVEKKRLEQELTYLEQRRARVQTRLAKISDQVDSMEAGARQCHYSTLASSEPTSNIYPPGIDDDTAPEDFGLVMLEY